MSCLVSLVKRSVTRPHLRPSPRHFSSSAPVGIRRSNLDEVLTAETAFDALDDYYDDNDAASAGHLMLRQQRQVLYYLRLIEHEMPKLVAYRKPFIPPTNDTPLIVRQLDYAGEEHPATAKRVIVAAVDQLPLKDATAVHKFKLMAGPRWTPNPPADAGFSGLRTWDHGFIKISCEDFPKPAMNLKWASDALDRLIAEANCSKDTFRNVPLDLRHVYSKTRKAKKGDHLRGRVFARPSSLDFPKEWLPTDKSRLIL